MQTKLKRKHQYQEESVEAKPRNTAVSGELKDLVKETASSAWRDLLGKSGKSVSEQIFGYSSTSEQSLTEGQEIDLKQIEKRPEVAVEHLNYFRKIESADTISESRVEMEVKRRVDEIRMEIRRLVKTSKVVEQTVKDATTEKAPVKPGRYHLNFFEFVLSVIKDAVRKLEDSASYGTLFTSKKRQKQYWTLYKSKGTQFGLSGERTTATQTG